MTDKENIDITQPLNSLQELSKLSLEDKIAYIYNYLSEVPWLLLIVTLVVSKMVGALASHLALKKVKSKLLDSNVEQCNIQRFMSSARWLVTVALVWFILVLFLPDDVETLFTHEVKFVFTGIGYWFIYSAWNVWMEYTINNKSTTISKEEGILLPFAFSIVRFLIIVFAFISLGSELGFNVWSIITALGAGSIMISFAAKDSVENFFGTLSIAIDHSFSIGDYIKVGNAIGTVEEINLRTTKIRTYNDTIITMPNGNVVRTPVENMSKKRGFRFSTQIMLDPENVPSAVDDFYKTIKNFIEHHDKVNFSSSYVNLDSVTDSGIIIGIDLFFNATDKKSWIEVQHDIVTSILEIAKERRVKFAYPTIIGSA